MREPQRPGRSFTKRPPFLVLLFDRIDAVKPPFLRYTAQSMRSSIGENYPGAVDEIVYRARHQYFIGRRGGGGTRADMNRDADRLIANPLAFAAMESRSQLHSKRRYRRPNVESGGYGLGRRVE